MSESFDYVMLYYILFALCLYIQQVVSVDQSGVMAFWLLDTGQRVKNHSGIHGDAEVTSLAQDSSGTMLYTGATDGTIKVYIYSYLCLTGYVPINV